MQRRLILLFALGATVLMRAVAGAEAAPVADAAESPYLTRDYLFLESPQIENYLHGLVERLIRAQPDARAANADIPRVLVFSSDALDVFADSRRSLLISTGTLRILESEDELAAVLGHELSHLLLKHPQQKDSLRTFPVGIETLAAVSSAARGGKAEVSTELSAFGEQKLNSMQAANLVWSDLLAPAWNRKQERAADIKGFELMRAAGYDPSAFGSLFQKLNAAALKRSKRMELLKKVLLRRAAASQKKTASSGKTEEIAKQVRSGLTEAALESAISGVSSFNREYDSPDERQKLLATYASEHRQKQRPARPEAHFNAVLRQGPGASLLAQDAAAIRTLAALGANDRATAGAAVKPLLPAAASGAHLATPHLNLAVGAWYQGSGRPDLGEQRARAWLTAKRPPAQAYVWLAYYQARRKEWQAAIKTLANARARVGSSAPFLPHLVSLARASGQTGAAEEYTRECRKEDEKNTGAALTALLRQDNLPTGLYADCVRRLGHEPPGNDARSVVMKTLKTPVQASKNLTQKLRDKLHRD